MSASNVRRFPLHPSRACQTAEYYFSDFYSQQNAAFAFTRAPPAVQAGDAVAFHTRAQGASGLPIAPAPAVPAALRPIAANNVPRAPIVCVFLGSVAMSSPDAGV